MMCSLAFVDIDYTPLRLFTTEITSLGKLPSLVSLPLAFMFELQSPGVSRSRLLVLFHWQGP
jgi:hypothetical protein